MCVSTRVFVVNYFWATFLRGEQARQLLDEQGTQRPALLGVVARIPGIGGSLFFAWEMPVSWAKAE